MKHPMVQTCEELKAWHESPAGAGGASLDTLKALVEGVIKSCGGSSENRSVFGESGGIETLGHIALQLTSTDGSTAVLSTVFDAVRCVCTKHGMLMTECL